MRALPRLLPARRLAWVVAACAPAWLLAATPLGSAPAVVVSLALLLLVVLDALAIPGEANVIVERELPASVGIGDVASGTYRVRPRWPGVRLRPAWLPPLAFTLYDALPPGVDRVRGMPASATLEADAEQLLDFEVRGRERGIFALGRVVLRMRGPLGLAQRALHVPMDDSIAVTPSFASVRRFRLLSLQHRLREAGVRNIRRRGEGTSFANLRDYAVGDDPRHIDWKATARRHKLISRAFTVEQGQTIMIAIDAGRMMTQLAGEFPRFELALSSAIVLADVAVHSGDEVGLIIFDDQIRAFVPPARGANALAAIRTALVGVTATMTEPDYAAAFRALATRHRKRSLIVLFTDVIDPRASRSLIALTARSTTRHLPLVVALRNDRLVEAAMPRARASSAQLYESAAAEELLQARDDALVRMRRTGVAAIDVSPRMMTAAVINHYLEIKARGAL